MGREKEGKKGRCRREAAVVSLKGKLLCVWGVGRWRMGR